MIFSTAVLGGRFKTSFHVYLIQHKTRDKKLNTHPGWVSYSGEGAFHTDFSITDPVFLRHYCKSQPGFLVALFLLGALYSF